MFATINQIILNRAWLDCPTHPNASVSSGYRIKFLQEAKEEVK